jgi:hypothetical protein
MASLLLFVVLQACDAATTLVFLRQGVAEGNPLVRFALGLGANPALPLVLLKAGACALAWAAWRSRRRRLLRPVNCFYAACVAWNVLATSL